MNTISLEHTLIELERQASAATSTDKTLLTQRLRRLTALLEPRAERRACLVEDDDLLFDNVPV